MSLITLLRRHPLFSYFVLAYGLTWGGILLAGGAARLQGQAVPPSQFPLVMLAMLLGPSAAGLAMTAATGGRPGLGDLATRMRRWQVSPRWYAVALLVNPVVTLAALWSLAALVSPAYTPGFNLLFGLAAGGLAGYCEEIGWSGFATPRLIDRCGALSGGLLLGVLWGSWHLLAGFVFSVPGQELLWLAEAVVYWVGALTAYRILMTWVYSHTGSVLIAQLMHLCFTGAFITLEPALAQPLALVYRLVIALTLWLLVGLLTLALRRPARAVVEMQPH
ncbi:MAG TPA: CPBP family glutamic-type intramembrane protease [Chloroflexaceae bacterium]|nr:CPBP family glutamic-type intramembrane protease [Chloroflexaceae bacterium]